VNLGKKLAEGYAGDSDVTEIEEPRTGPIMIVAEDVRGDVPTEPVEV